MTRLYRHFYAAASAFYGEGIDFIKALILHRCSKYL